MPTVGYYPWILPLPVSVHFFLTSRTPGAVPTRQTSSSGRPKSPRIQVVLPEDLCQRLSVLAEDESRTVSNMAKVLIQQGVERLEQQRQSLQEGVVDRGRGNPSPTASSPTSTSGQASPAARDRKSTRLNSSHSSVSRMPSSA